MHTAEAGQAPVNSSDNLTSSATASRLSRVNPFREKYFSAVVVSRYHSLMPNDFAC
jgi:hypothetical protein